MSGGLRKGQPFRREVLWDHEDNGAEEARPHGASKGSASSLVGRMKAVCRGGGDKAPR